MEKKTSWLNPLADKSQMMRFPSFGASYGADTVEGNMWKKVSGLNKQQNKNQVVLGCQKAATQPTRLGKSLTAIICSQTLADYRRPILIITFY